MTVKIPAGYRYDAEYQPFLHSADAQGKRDVRETLQTNVQMTIARAGAVSSESAATSDAAG
jgi:hypothetical protein